MPLRRRLLGSAVILIFAGGAHAQPWDGGLPPLQYVDPATYGGHTQNWDVVEDVNGFIYVGNGSGVLEYDGARWRRIALPGGIMVRSLAVDSTNTIYVGGMSEFGYLAPDEAGRLHYRSLRGEVASEEDVGEIWIVAAHPNGIYFQSNAAIYRWHRRKLSVIPTDSFFHTLFPVGDALYVTMPGTGLSRIIGDAVVPIPHAEIFGSVPLFSLDAFGDDGTLLAATFGNELLLFDGREARRFQTEIDAWLREYGGSKAVWLSDGSMAVASRGGGGVRVIDEEGRLVWQIDADDGIVDGTVNELFVSRSGELWMALNNGLARSLIPSPVSLFDERVGLEGSVATVARYGEMLFAGTERGLFRLDGSNASAGHPRFEQILSGVNVWDLVPIEDALMVLTNNGMYEWRGGRLLHSGDTSFMYSGSYSDRNPDRLLIGTDAGLRILRRGSAGWQYPSVPVAGIGRHGVRTIVESDDGSVWLGTRTGVVYRLKFNDAGEPDVETFQAGEGVPAGEVDVSLIDQRVVLSTTEGIYVYDPRRRRFVNDDTCILPPDAADRYVEFAVQVSSGAVVVGRGEQPSTRLAVVHHPFKPECEVDESAFSATPTEAFHGITVDGESVWIGGAGGLIHYALSQESPSPPAPRAVVRQVTWGDSLLFAGAAGEVGTGTAVALPFSSHRLSFDIAAPGVPGGTRMEYSAFFEGVDEGWTAWKVDPYLEYTSVPPGAHRFLVRARRAGGTAGAVGIFDVTILPPWYRTWWAYALYVLVVLGTIIPLTRYASQRRLQRQVRQLEDERRLQDERERISRDLHDNVGAQLSNILSGIELINLSTHAGEHELAQTYLASLGDDARTTMAQLRETIWTLHHDTVTVDDLRNRILHFLESQTRYRERPSFQCMVNGNGLQLLSPIQALHLFRIAQEAITNSLKHSGASVLRVTLEVNEDVISLTVSDDGTFRQPDGNGDLQGFGLRGIESRARAIGATFALRTDDGTHVAVELPAGSDLRS